MRAVIAQENSDSFDAVRQILLGLGSACDTTDCVLFSDLPARLARGPADLILVRAEPGMESALATIRQAALLTPVPVMAYGPVSDARHILGVGRSGAREYLDEDRLRQDLEAALERLRLANEVKYGEGSVVSVVSATPGCGVTTVSTNLSFTLALAHPGQIVLVEFGRPPADLTVNLDLTPSHSVTEVCAHWQKLDVALLKQGLAQHPGGVAVLAHEPETLTTDAIDPQAVRPLLVLLRTLFATSVLDLGHALGEEQYEAMRLSDQLIVVVRLDVPALRQTRSLLRALNEHGIPNDRLRLVANRYGQPGQVPWKQAEETLGAPFLEFIPDDCGTSNEALNRGQPLVLFAPRTRISRRFAQLVERLAKQGVPPG